MNDADSKKLEEMQVRLKQAEKSLHDQILDDATRIEKRDEHITEQNREIERLRNSWDRWEKQNKERNYQRRHRKWALEQCRTWQRYFCFYKDDAVRFHSTRADKAEADNRRLQERVRELAEIALDWIGSAQQARGSIFGPRDKVDYKSAQKRVYALQHKEKE